MLGAKYGKELFVTRPRPSFWVTCLIVLFLALPLGLRSTSAFARLKKDSINNFEIQYVPGMFLRKYYPNEVIAVEALGAASYYTDGKKMDIVGLGDVEVARSSIYHYYSPEFLDTLSKQEHVRIALASEYSTPVELLARWKKIATWQTPMALGGAYVSFYAVDEKVAPELKRDLMEYQPSLPEGEGVIYY
jgi:hypothetical protein